MSGNGVAFFTFPIAILELRLLMCTLKYGFSIARMAAICGAALALSARFRSFFFYDFMA